MSEFGETPLGIVRYELWQGSDRNPTGTPAVMDMIHEALGGLGESAEPLTDAILTSLDPVTNKGLGAKNALLLEQLAHTVGNDEISRVRQWGALSLLGALTLTHNPATNERDLLANPVLRQTQVAGHVARNALQAMQASPNTPKMFAQVAQGLLARSTLHPEDLAIEFEVLGLREYARQRVIDTAPAIPRVSEEAPMQGSSISDPYEVRLFPLSYEAQTKIEAMDWLDLDTDLVVKARDIYLDNKKIAQLIDLTESNRTLKRLRQRAEGHIKLGHQFWPWVATSIAHYVHTNRAERLRGEKVTTFYAKNKAKSNAMRAYYVPLDKSSEDENVPRIALIAAFRGKNNQAAVLRYIAIGGSTLSEA